MQQESQSFPDQRRVGGRVSAAPEQMEPLVRIPTFLDQTFRMIEQEPADVVCWSRAGDSFIVKQVRTFEDLLLPSYYNHNNFMSFVRQLNFYGFQKVKGKAPSRLSSADGGTQGAAAVAAAAKGSEPWAEFRHPQFRRGRRDLLMGITRQKDPGRLRRRQVDARKSDIIGSLVTDVYTVSSGLRTANGKLDSIMSMLLSMGSGKNQAARSNHTPPASRDSIVRDDAAAAAAASEGGDDANFGGGGAQSASAAAAARGEFGQSLVGRDSAGAGTRRGGRDLYAYGELFDYRPSPPRIPVDHQQQEWAGHPPLHSHRFHQPSPAERYPVVSNHIRYDVVRPQPLPPLGAAVEARASENSSTGPPQQLPPLLSSPRALESATCSSFGREQGGEGGKDTESPRPSPPYPGDGSAPGGRICSPSATDDARPNDTQRQRQLRGQAGPMHSTRPLLNREESDSAVASPGGGRCAAVAHQMHEGLGGGTTAML